MNIKSNQTFNKLRILKTFVPFLILRYKIYVVKFYENRNFILTKESVFQRYNYYIVPPPGGQWGAHDQTT